jgi:hypothetical protein
MAILALTILVFGREEIWIRVTGYRIFFAR